MFGFQVPCAPVISDVRNDGLWHHIAVVHSAGGLGWVYLDGNIVINREPFPALGNNAPSLIVGWWAAPTTVTNSPFNATVPFHGYIDDVRVWKAERSQGQIRAAMFGNFIGDEDGLFSLFEFAEAGGDSFYQSCNNSFADNSNGPAGNATLHKYPGSAQVTGVVRARVNLRPLYGGFGGVSLQQLFSSITGQLSAGQLQADQNFLINTAQYQNTDIDQLPFYRYVLTDAKFTFAGSISQVDPELKIIVDIGELQSSDLDRFEAEMTIQSEGDIWTGPFPDGSFSLGPE